MFVIVKPMNEEEMSSVQADLMRKAASLLEDRMTRIDTTGRGVALAPMEDMAVRMFKVRSLRLYIDALNHLANEVAKSDLHFHFFSLAHVRTLLEVYGRFLNLLVNCEDQKKQALTCIAYQLRTFATVMNGLEYKTVLSISKPFLDEQGISFPEDSAEFDERRDVRKRGLAFAKIKDILTIENVKAHSIFTKEVFTHGVATDMYSYISEFLHGNPFFYTGKEQNQRFWIIATSLSTTAFLIELVDRYTLNNRQPTDARMWLAEVKKRKEELTAFWINKRKEMKS